MDDDLESINSDKNSQLSDEDEEEELRDNAARVIQGFILKIK